MRTIWKIQLAITDHQSIMLPEDSLILTVQMQRGIPCLWVLVEPNLQKEERYIRIVGTGHQIGYDERLQYIGTVQMAESSLVWHIFEMRIG